MSTSRLLPAAAVAAVLLVAGCSGSTPEPAATTAPPASPASSAPTPTATGGSGPATTSSPATGLPAGGPVPSGFTVTSITTVAGGTTYALGTAPCRTAPCTSVVRSTDRGRTWRGLPAPRTELDSSQTREPETGTVRELRFATPRDGWAYGGGLWSTHDGGASWKRVDVGGSVLDLATDGTTAWAVVASCRGDACGGTRLTASAVRRDSFGTVPGVSLPATGFATVTTGAAGTVVSAGDVAWVEPRGGSWRKADPGCGANPAAEVVAAAGDTSVVAFCGDSAAGSSYFTVRRSADGGRTWTAAGGQGGRVPNGLLTFTAGSGSTVAIASASTDLRGGFATSTDGGRTWRTAAPGTSSAGWRYVGAAGRTTLVALAQPAQAAYWTSTDAGRTWTRTAVR